MGSSFTFFPLSRNPSRKLNSFLAKKGFHPSNVISYRVYSNLKAFQAASMEKDKSNENLKMSSLQSGESFLFPSSSLFSNQVSKTVCEFEQNSSNKSWISKSSEFLKNHQSTMPEQCRRRAGRKSLSPTSFTFCLRHYQSAARRELKRM